MNRKWFRQVARRLLSIAAAAAVGLQPALAAVPGYINYQARLTNASGVPLEGSQTLTFRFYPTSADPTPLATQTLTATANKGLVSAQIPASASVFSAAERWLEVAVGAETLGPRTRLAAVPYAFKAAEADQAATAASATDSTKVAKAGDTMSGALSMGGFSITNLGAPSAAADAATKAYADSVSGASQWTPSGANIYYNAGNVGIGTETPGGKLHVHGGAVLVTGVDAISGTAEDSNTRLLIHADGSFSDASGNGHAIMTNGNAHVDSSRRKFGSGSALFDGSGDFLSIADSPDWDFGTGDFTIDFWFFWNCIASRRGNDPSIPIN